MADIDPISSDSTPNKRRRVDVNAVDASNRRTWDALDDEDAEWTVDDFGTQATIPLATQKRKLLQYPAEQFRADMSSMTARPTPQSRTLPTQTQTFRHVTQPTQLLPQREIPNTSDVLVERSSPPLLSPPKPAPAPIQRAPFAKPRGGLLASSIGPLGTAFRPPLGVQSRPPPVEIPSDSDDDPPIHHSDDEETQGLRSNIRPTNFRKGGRGLDSTPNRSDKVAESPRARNDVLPAGGSTHFSNLMQSFAHNPRRAADDSSSAYGSTSRPPRPQTIQIVPSRAGPVADIYQTLDDVPDRVLRRKIEGVQQVFPGESVQRCYDALVRSKGNESDAMTWLSGPEEQAPTSDDHRDELGSLSPVAKRGVAKSLADSQAQSSQPVRQAKQSVQLETKTIAERYAQKPVQPVVESLSSDEETPKPRRRLQQGRKRRGSTPPSSPPVQNTALRVPRPKAIVIDSDDESDSGLGRGESEDVVEPVEVAFDQRLLKFINECSPGELAELCAQPEDVVKIVLDQRPFSTLDAARAVTAPTKTGKMSKARPIGERLVEIASQMWSGYDAVDELVADCERLAQPIQQALKGWGVGASEGELQLMNLDDAHDSGIGTPASSCPSDDVPAPQSSRKSKGKFLNQPENMGHVQLKDYQLVGLNWLNLLWTKRISCILADEMGLGKTCQVISFFAYLQLQETDGVHLVIVPPSTLENWLREFARFGPSLHVRPYYGSQDERAVLQYEIEKDFAAIDVIVTTYTQTDSPDDNRFLRSLAPAVCVYDEAHKLRNPNTKVYKQLMRIPADFKIFLTGTPLQNNLQELVAVLAFIMPQVFESKREQLDYIFKAKATTKNADHAALLSAERVARARMMVTPFILRRKKAQVLDLPAKHSRVEYCEKTPSQAAHYSGLADRAQQLYVVGAGISRAQAAKERSNVLMALRQAAIHPLLAMGRIYNEKKIEKIHAAMMKQEAWSAYDSDLVLRFLTGEGDGAGGKKVKGGDFGMHLFCTEPAQAPYLQKFALKKQEWLDSGKVKKFQELVTGFVTNGDRILVFSQFTVVMDILEAVLETMEVKFLRLDGSTATAHRQPLIDRFNDDETIPLFMLSTKAGGAGINLASANKVIIFDSGFNPQDDIQAENRAHRVGQTREVEVIRLVTRGTVEEQIHALGESKLALDERVSGEGATSTEDKAAQKQGEQLVQEMFVKSLQVKEEEGANEKAEGDIKDAFRSGMEKAGVSVKSKQAQY